LLASTLDEPVEAALARLSPELRACVILVDIEELDYAEAAVALGVPLGTVRSRLFRARQQLHALLTPHVRR
jgi:RNA polymerase sigma-70 factor (ECF subfamily)